MPAPTTEQMERARTQLNVWSCDTERESGWGDSNPRPLDPQSSALTKLRYTPQEYCGTDPGRGPNAVGGRGG